MAISDLEMADMVREVSHGTGAGPLALEGPVAGYRGFAAAGVTGATFPYAIVGVDVPAQWETGAGTLDGLGRLVRVPHASSAGGGAVDLSAGVKHVALTPDAGWLKAVNGHGHDAGEIDGLGGAAALEVGTVAGTLAAGDDGRITGALQRGGGAMTGALTLQGAPGAALHAATKAYVDGAPVQPVNANLTAISALSTAADKVTYWTGSGAAALTTLSAFGRSLIDDASAAGARATLGLGTAAVEAVGTSGAALARLDGANSWSGTQSFASAMIAGGAISGLSSCQVVGASGAAISFIDSPTGQYAITRFRTGNSNRWDFGKDSGAESGSNAGSNFTVRCFDDAGTYLSSPFTIVRATGDFVSAGNFRPLIDNSRTLGLAAVRWSTIYAASGTISTSDQRAKQDVGGVEDAWLDAWDAIEWVRYRFIDAVAAKGEHARWHVGLVAQQVRDAFAVRGLNAEAIGLLCHDAWDAEAEVVDDDGVVIRPAREAGDRWGLRYDECLAMEAACQRRRMDRIEAMLTALSNGGGDVAG